MFIWGHSRRAAERAAAWEAQQAAEAEVRKAGGVRVPGGALLEVKKIIGKAFDNLEDSLDKHSIDLDEFYLDQIKLFEEEIVVYLSSIIRKLVAKTSDYGVLTKEHAQSRIDEEVNKVFDYFLDFSFKYKFVFDAKAEVAFIALKREIYFKIFEYIESWKY
jgi:hypothetical protein